MAIFGALAAPALGMLTQASAFGTISQNITNNNTGGYKAADTRFHTVLASKFDSNSDVGGVLAIRKNLISNQGNTVSTDNYTDVAINGDGLFLLNTEVDGSGDVVYSRDGAFEIFSPSTTSVNGVFRADGSFDTSGATSGTTVTVNASAAFLRDKSGQYLQGWLPDSTGAFDRTSATTAIRIDRFAFNSNAAATTNAILAANLPATTLPGVSKTFKASIYDPLGNLKTFETVWTRTANPQEWILSINPTNGTTTSAAETIKFSTVGRLATGATHSFAVTWNDGQASSVSLDISDVSSIGSDQFFLDFTKDGRGPGDLASFSFDKEGHVNGTFTNGTLRALYKLPVATFVNPDGLDLRQGNLFTESLSSGQVTLREAGFDSFAIFRPFAHELSNVNLGTEFNKMIMTQQAYNSAATIFRTVDEMLQTASNLKS